MQVRTKPGRMGSYVDEFTSPVHTCMGICAGMKRLGIGMSDQYKKKDRNAFFTVLSVYVLVL